MLFVIACATVAIAAGAYILLPLFREPKGILETEVLAETEMDRWLSQKAVVENNLKDLEFEYQMGRLAAVDFQQLEAGLKGEVAAILQKLDPLGVADNLDKKIEEEIAFHKAKLKAPDVLSSSSVNARCPGCGAEIVPDKKFCAECGWRF